MAKSLVIYDLGKKSRAEKTRIVKSLFGYKDKSYHGKYEYLRHGLLAGIKYKRLTKTALLIERKDQGRVLKLLKKFNIIPAVMTIRD